MNRNSHTGAVRAKANDSRNRAGRFGATFPKPAQPVRSTTSEAPMPKNHKAKP